MEKHTILTAQRNEHLFYLGNKGNLHGKENIWGHLPYLALIDHEEAINIDYILKYYRKCSNPLIE